VIKKGLLVLATFFLLMAAVFLAAILWPLPEINPPIQPRAILLKSINIIDVNNGNVLYCREVFIRGNRITEIGDTVNYSGADSVLIIDGGGKYLLPGLWNMHSHSTQHSKWLHHPLQVANGVTGLRDMSGTLDQPDNYWAGTRDRQRWNQDIRTNRHVGPRYVLQSSFQIDGAGPIPDGFSEYFKLAREEDVFKLINYYQQEGADFIKVYAEIPPGPYKKLAREAPKSGLHLAGHKPLNVSLEECLMLGQRSFEHGRIFLFECFPGAEQLRTASNKRQQFALSMKSMVEDFDTVEARRLMDLMHEYNSHWTPTLLTLKMSANADRDTFTNTPYLKYIPKMRLELWWRPDLNRSARKNRTPEGKGINMNFYQAAKRQVGMAHRRRVPIMLGTDVTDTYVFPGFGVHDELQELTECGMSNLQAIRSATIVPAKFCGLINDFGSVEVGKMADLILLEKNPLENIANTREINGVILNGTYYDRSKLDQLQNLTASLAGSFHMNVKFVYSLFSSPLMRKQIAD